MSQVADDVGPACACIGRTTVFVVFVVLYSDSQFSSFATSTTSDSSFYVPEASSAVVVLNIVIFVCKPQAQA